jgi:hypothetical protein
VLHFIAKRGVGLLPGHAMLNAELQQLQYQLVSLMLSMKLQLLQKLMSKLAPGVVSHLIKSD